jgi:dimethylargininase
MQRSSAIEARHVKRIAITRRVSPNIAQCELTHLGREPIDLARAEAQHDAYVTALRTVGCVVTELPAEASLPDSVFVEDAAFVLDELAIIARPGAESRRPETATIETALTPYRRCAAIQGPDTLDGGDVLVVDRDVFIGLSSRTTAGAVGQVRGILSPLGYRVHALEVADCLHLKSAVGRVGANTLLLNPDLVDPSLFGDRTIIAVDPAEPAGGCALQIGETVIYPAEFALTLARLHAAGIRTLPVALSELAKAEAGVTCCSLVFAG